MRVFSGSLCGVVVLMLWTPMAWAAATGQVRVDLQNMPAEIVLDGFLTGQNAPAVIEDVAPGEHEIQVEYGCLLATSVVFVKAETTTRAKMRIKKRAGTGTVRVRDLPPWAEVFVDGRPVEEASKGVEAACGERVVSVEASGVEPWSSRVVVNTGQWSTVAVPQDWEGMEGDLDLVMRNDDNRRVRSGFEEEEGDDPSVEFDDWEDVDSDRRTGDDKAQQAKERQAQEARERAEQERLAADRKKLQDKLTQLKLARESSAEALQEAEGQLAEVDALIADTREALEAIGGRADSWTDAIVDRGDEKESDSWDGSQGNREETQEPELLAVDRGQMRVERQRRRQEEAQAERRAEEERARLQQRILEGRGDEDEYDELDSLDELDEPYEYSRNNSGRSPGPKRRGVGSMKKPLTVASGVVAVGGLGLGLAGVSGWKKGQETWENMLVYCDDDSTDELPGLPREDVCPYTENPLSIPSEHGQETLEDIATGKKRTLIGFSMTIAGGVGAGASWLYLDAGAQGAMVGFGGRW